MVKVGRKTANDGVKIIVEAQIAAENGGIRAKRSMPQAVTNDGRGGEAEGFVLSS